MTRIDPTRIREAATSAAVVAVEYLYQPWMFEDLDGYLVTEVRQLRIVRKTPKRVFFTDMFGCARYVDRQALDRDGCAGIGRGTGRYQVYADRADAEPAPRGASKSMTDTLAQPAAIP